MSKDTYNTEFSSSLLLKSLVPSELSFGNHQILGKCNSRFLSAGGKVLRIKSASYWGYLLESWLRSEKRAEWKSSCQSEEFQAFHGFLEENLVVQFVSCGTEFCEFLGETRVVEKTE